jgi:hypothetical protein
MIDVQAASLCPTSRESDLVATPSLTQPTKIKLAQGSLLRSRGCKSSFREKGSYRGDKGKLLKEGNHQGRRDQSRNRVSKLRKQGTH